MPATIKPMPYHKNASLKNGFTLIEVLLTLLFSTILVVLLLTAATTLLQTYKTNQQSLAARIATKEIENLRQTSYSSLPSSGSFSDADLSKLTSSSGNLTVSNYQSSADIKQITVNVSWVQNGASKQVILETLIYKNGI